jgi:hypothetical protein
MLLGSRQLHRAGLIKLATAKRAYALSGVVWRLGWRVIRGGGSCRDPLSRGKSE